ncbi:hypothetical protein BDK51DRAFT_35178 [Blyttiomyces helicus]|uniref:Secreted protein n=1 Tax=Blyttiomyces helicus TaxID=388810 RepID=A0A4P9WGM5_9FUNG|nr:hypothetical protein BDK51DRAFT_35178 [Blyttiomyces helicus]|eukprot:RKO91502.1 hypothetical protein BDK51DRAFT_35178 [Blyttiomyces helicus]
MSARTAFLVGLKLLLSSLGGRSSGLRHHGRVTLLRPFDIATRPDGQPGFVGKTSSVPIHSDERSCPSMQGLCLVWSDLKTIGVRWRELMEGLRGWGVQGGWWTVVEGEDGEVDGHRGAEI